jgi:hypothetical protein
MGLQAGGNERRARRIALERRRLFRLWTRRVHFHLGLWLITFIWFFAVSGLLLNHPEWEITRFWPQREEATAMHAIDPPAGGSDIEIARDILGQLGIAAEIGTIERIGAEGRFAILAVRPGRQFRIDAQPDSGRATVARTRVNAIGIADALHKFTGVDLDDPGAVRDWLLTGIWSIAMDAVAAGLLVLVLSGVYLWLRLGTRRLAGTLALAAGTLTSLLFVFGLTRWL